MENLYLIQDIKREMHHVFDEITLLCSSTPDPAFFFQPGNKWSAAQNLEHLIMSTRPLASAMRLPKVTFRVFGNLSRNVYEYDTLVSKYLEKLKQQDAQAPARYTPQGTNAREKEALYREWKSATQRLIDRIDKWSEEELNAYLIPHPLLGRIAVREMLFFTIYHTQHHLFQMMECIKAYPQYSKPT